MAYDKVVDSAVLDGALTGIADAIRGKTGNTDKLTLDEMAAAIAGISVGGGGEQFSALVDGRMTDFVANSEMQGIRSHAFYNATNLRSADLSELGKKGGKLRELIGYDAFHGCTALEHITLPMVLAEAGAGEEWMFSRAFEGCGLREFSTEYAGSFGWNSVQNFKNGKSLRTVRIPNIIFVSMDHFNGCSALELVEFGGGTIGNNVFAGCAALNTIIIRSDTLTALGNQNAFSGVPGPVQVHVNAALIEEYRAATNWASLYAAGTVDFVAIEGSEYE